MRNVRVESGTETVNPEFLSRQAMRAALRKCRKVGRPFAREEVLKMHIQTVDPLQRTAIVVMGLLVGALACPRDGRDFNTCLMSGMNEETTIADFLGPWVEPDWDSGLIDR